MKPKQILHEIDLKFTPCRQGIISTIAESKNALSENEIKEKLDEKFDRTTFYRSFKTLLDKNIIHKIVVDNQVVKYALDNSITLKVHHAHFYCYQCGAVKCMDEIPVTSPKLPDGFYIQETEVIIKGLCDKCNLK
ncbi:MAG: transcriptional repressor [Bacteroidales bacterium]|nr:transcriptional repressor [Bacteroidales bacterium]